MVKIGPKDHFWTYMGWDTELKVEYSYCDRCKKYRSDGKSIGKKEYLKRVEAGKVEIR